MKVNKLGILLLCLNTKSLISPQTYAYLRLLLKVASVRSKEFLTAKFASVLVGRFVIASIKARNQVTELFSSITHYGGHMGIKRGHFQRCFYSPFFINPGFKKCTRNKGDFLLSQDIVSFFQV